MHVINNVNLLYNNLGLIKWKNKIKDAHNNPYYNQIRILKVRGFNIKTREYDKLTNRVNR